VFGLDSNLVSLYFDLFNWLEICVSGKLYLRVFLSVNIVVLSAHQFWEKNNLERQTVSD
jgi:hypothetical protein